MIELAHDAPALPSAAVQAAFNIANSLGAWVGGFGLQVGLGFTTPSTLGAVLAAIGLMIMVGATVINRNREDAESHQAVPG